MPETAGEAVCLSCGRPPERGGYRMPLCADCRTTLARRPFPTWIWVTAGLVGVLFVVSAVHAPGGLRALTAYQRGQAAEARQDYARAAASYRQVAAVFPDNTGVLARLFVADAYAPRTPLAVAEAFRMHSLLVGREFSPESIGELNRADDHLWDVNPGELDPQTLAVYLAEEARQKSKGGR